MKKLVFVACILFLAACSVKRKEAVAHIIQRRVEKSGKLLISYRFSDGQKIIFDSMETGNRIIPHDSVKVLFSTDEPHSSHLVLP